MSPHMREVTSKNGAFLKEAYMETEDVIRRLNWFYMLEINQVELYRGQSRQVDDLYVKIILERVAEIEYGHVENIRQKILALGGKPTLLGETIAPLTGKAAGLVTGVAGLVSLLKADIALEEKAMKDYKAFISSAGDDGDLLELLWSNLADEDLHTAWFANKVKELEEVL